MNNMIDTLFIFILTITVLRKGYLHGDYMEEIYDLDKMFKENLTKKFLFDAHKLFPVFIPYKGEKAFKNKVMIEKKIKNILRVFYITLISYGVFNLFRYIFFD